MPCVNAVGEESTPIVVFEGVRALARFTKEYPGVLLAMDPAGYMSCEIFLAWCHKWELATRRPDGRARLLLFDGHFSHMAVDGVLFLRAHNVRVLTVHPHTTHVACVLDNGPFKRFNYHLNNEIASLSRPGTAVNDSKRVRLHRARVGKDAQDIPARKNGPSDESRHLRLQEDGHLPVFPRAS